VEHKQVTGKTKYAGSTPLPSVIFITQPFFVQSALMVSPQKAIKKMPEEKSWA
jgi:hypothetical protein